MANLLYQGHASLRITTNSGLVIYVDPFAGEGYDVPADLILITHAHGDHNQVQLCAKKPDCKIISHTQALQGGKYNTLTFKDVTIQPTKAQNKNHSPLECVGYILSFDSIKLYISGDTSKTDHMHSYKQLSLDYAIFCGDGVYNMDLAEAAECAEIVGAKHNIIVHIVAHDTGLFDKERAEKWTAPNKLILCPNQLLQL